MAHLATVYIHTSYAIKTEHSLPESIYRYLHIYTSTYALYTTRISLYRTPMPPIGSASAISGGAAGGKSRNSDHQTQATVHEARRARLKALLEAEELISSMTCVEAGEVLCLAGWGLEQSDRFEKQFDVMLRYRHGEFCRTVGHDGIGILTWDRAVAFSAAIIRDHQVPSPRLKPQNTCTTLLLHAMATLSHVWSFSDMLKDPKRRLHVPSEHQYRLIGGGHGAMDVDSLYRSGGYNTPEGNKVSAGKGEEHDVAAAGEEIGSDTLRGLPAGAGDDHQTNSGRDGDRRESPKVTTTTTTGIATATSATQTPSSEGWGLTSSSAGKAIDSRFRADGDCDPSDCDPSDDDPDNPELACLRQEADAARGALLVAKKQMALYARRYEAHGGEAYDPDGAHGLRLARNVLEATGRLEDARYDLQRFVWANEDDREKRPNPPPPTTTTNTTTSATKTTTTFVIPPVHNDAGGISDSAGKKTGRGTAPRKTLLVKTDADRRAEHRGFLYGLGRGSTTTTKRGFDEHLLSTKGSGPDGDGSEAQLGPSAPGQPLSCKKRKLSGGATGEESMATEGAGGGFIGTGGLDADMDVDMDIGFDDDTDDDWYWD